MVIHLGQSDATATGYLFQIVFTFLVPARQGSPEQRAIKWVCVYVCQRDWKFLEVECWNMLKCVSKWLSTNVKELCMFRSKIFVSTCLLCIV